MIMGVGYPDVALAVDRQSGGFAELVVGGLPAAEEPAVGGEDLDAGGHVDDIEAVLPVDRHGAWLLQPAVGNSPAAPDGLQVSGGGLLPIAAGGQEDRKEYHDTRQRRV